MTARRRTIVAVGAALVIGFSSVSKAAEPRSLTVTSAGSSLELPATLFVPEGAGRFPAVVIMHDCSGLGPRSSGAPRRWAEHLVAQGYVVIIADSFSPRGLPNGVCTIPPAESARAAAGVRWSDAFGALAVLRSLPFVDRERIGIMGGSHGGASTLATMAQNTP
jgi:dienelactone hydrolase